jgi:hypothetical protein
MTQLQPGDLIAVYQFLPQDISHRALAEYARNPWAYHEPHDKRRVFPFWDIFCLAVKTNFVRIGSPEFQGELHYTGFWVPARNCELLQSGASDLSWAVRPTVGAAKIPVAVASHAVAAQEALF